MQWIILYIIFVNLIAYFAFKQDKERAQKKERRTPEQSLLFIAFVGGAIGSWMGMKKFRHKTRKKVFKIWIPVCIAWNISFIVVLVWISMHV